MKLRPTRARLISGLLLASTMTLLQTLPALAESTGPAAPGTAAIRTASDAPSRPAGLTFHSPVGPGQGPLRGVTLEEALAAIDAASSTRHEATANQDAVTAGAIRAVFIPQAGTLAVTGSNGDDTIVVSRDAAGKLLVNGGAVAVLGGIATVANTTVVEIFGLDGNDNLSLNEANGALPGALIFGGGGNDTLTGGSSLDQLFGQAGKDALLGKGGNDFLFGGADNDTLTGGDGDDQVFGESGDDRMIWNPGDDTDLNEGGDGIDTVEVNGGNGSEIFTATPNGLRVRFDRTDPAPFSLDIGTTEKLVLNANGGDDTFTGANGLAPLIQLTVDGGAGNDTITGGDGDDRLLGGDGNDTITGGRGTDVVLLGAGDDVFVWNPGDGSDTVEGQAGSDTMLFNGANIAEKIDVSANGQRVRFTRDIANITMDLDGVEAIDFNALGGADTITINDLSGTATARLDLDLAAQPGTGTGDNQADTVIINGTNGADTVEVTGSGTAYSVAGLPALVQVSGSEGVLDSLKVNLLAGDDNLAATTLPAGIVTLTVDGGTGNDTLVGSAGVDVLLGGDGNDTIAGGRGDDSLSLGAGDDVAVWNPGDGNDIIEGQAGTDRMLFNGANVAENINVSANGERVRFTRDIANITMDLNDVESIDFNALGGADVITVNDLTGTDLSALQVNLEVGTGDGDGQADAIIVNGTSGADTIAVTGSTAGVTVAGLQTTVKILGSEGANDQLTVNALGGDDVVDASGLAAGAIKLGLSGGPGNDLLMGSSGDDLLFGNQGTDVLLMGAGDDAAVWNPGDGSDTIEGQAGTDTLRFNGANVSEVFDIASNGSRIRFTRDVAAIVMDVDGVERIDVNELGGADVTTVNDLTGTALTDVNLNLSNVPGGSSGDGAVDTVTVKGTAGDDNVVVVGDAGSAEVLGLAAHVAVQGTDPTQDALIVTTLAGDDVVEASALPANVLLLTADGGDGNDVLIGSAGNDVLIGGAGDDVLIGNDGQDVLNGGPGSNILLQ